MAKRNREATYTTAESASVLAVLGDFHLLDLLTERGTITDTVFTNNSDLLSALSLETMKRVGDKWGKEKKEAKSMGSG